LFVLSLSPSLSPASFILSLGYMLSSFLLFFKFFLCFCLAVFLCFVPSFFAY
jgi:hypothetical protein